MVFSNMYIMLKLNCIARNNKQTMFNSIQTAIGETNQNITNVDSKLENHKMVCKNRFKTIKDSLKQQEIDRQNRAPTVSNTMSEIVSWNNKLLADMRKAAQQGRIFGLTPKNR